MKKVLTLLTAFCLLFSLAACGGAGTTTASGSASENGQDTGLTMSWTPVEGVVSRTYEHYESSQAFFGETYTDSRDTEYGYDAAGNQLYIRDLDDDGYQNENVFTYDADGNMLTWICSNSEEGEYSRYIYEYVNGLLVKETDYSEAFGNGIMSYEYDGKGNCIKIITSDLNGNVESIEETTYNENGDMLTDIYNESDGSPRGTQTSIHLGR